MEGEEEERQEGGHRIKDCGLTQAHHGAGMGMLERDAASAYDRGGR
jgi:hypothetical protein